jgi:uncharacterized protein (TIGR02646 family)
VIPVAAQPEPPAFDAEVRQKGVAHLKKNGFELHEALPLNANIAPYWRACLTDLHRAYGGVCAYLCVYVERVTGAVSVDHFIAKSTQAGLAYEWHNYRLACSTMNSRKHDYADVLDPFSVKPGEFRLELATGHVYPNPDLDCVRRRVVQATISRLKLDAPQCRDLRASGFQACVEGHVSADYLRRKSPFVRFEAERQGLL